LRIGRRKLSLSPNRHCGDSLIQARPGHLHFTSLFPYYGGKSIISHLYPEPIYRTVIEPFAGGASYSLRYSERDVILNDLWEPVYQVWKFVTSPDALRICRDRVPREVEAGDMIHELTRPDDPIGLVYLMQAQFAQSAFGMSVRTKVSPFGAKCWGTFRERIEHWLPRIAHWRVMHGPYADIPNQEATWYVDPPYQNAAGSKYKESSVDYAHLGAWCKSRQGHVIVAENKGADWLPFRTLTEKRAAGFAVSDEAAEMGEVIYTQQDAEDVGVFA
jgi:hypothetical protein